MSSHSFLTWNDLNIDVPMGSSGHIRTTCPECSGSRKKSKEKCLSVDISKRVFYCHHCSWSGSLNGNKKIDYRIHFTKPEYKPKPKLPKSVIDWFSTRGIPTEILIKNKIGFGDNRDIQFPYYDKNGSVVLNIKHRSNPKKFWQEKGAEKCLYRLDKIFNSTSDILIITEGEIDALSFDTIGYGSATSIPDGAPSTNAKEFHTKFDFLKSAENIFDSYNKIILAVDNDAPGKLVEQELARRIGYEKCYKVEYPQGCKDANDVLIKHGRKALKDVVLNASPYPIKGLFNAIDFKEQVYSLYQKGENRGLSAGWSILDEYYTVKAGEFTVVTGIPGSGKSNFMDCIAVNMMREHDWKFVYFSPENWPIERHLQGILEKIIMKPFSKAGRYIGRMDEDEIEDTLEVIKKYMFFIYPDEDNYTVDDILKKAKVAIFRHGINGVIIDPWNEIEHNYHRIKMTEAQYLSTSLSKIRQFAKRNAVHIWVVAHPKNQPREKDGTYKPPTMYEISGGAHWRNKADNGICLHREDYNNDETTVYIQKIRFREVGRLGEIKLKYSIDTGIYNE